MAQTNKNSRVTRVTHSAKKPGWEEINQAVEKVKGEI
jgi:preprotein translocase subunit Sss1